MSYNFRETYRQDNDTYVENRGYAHTVKRGDPEFAMIDAQFGNMLQIGQTAVRGMEDEEWSVSDSFPLLIEVKASKNESVKEVFELARKNSVIMSSLGFPIDATDRSIGDINGLITLLSNSADKSAVFCDAENVEHTVSLQQLETMRFEILSFAERLYARKWELRKAINTATSVDAVNEIAIDFVV